MSEIMKNKNVNATDENSMMNNGADINDDDKLFQALIRDSLNASYEEEGISVSDELINKTLARISELGDETPSEAGNVTSLQTSASSARVVLFKRIARYGSVAAAVIVLFIVGRIFYLNRGMKNAYDSTQSFIMMAPAAATETAMPPMAMETGSAKEDYKEFPKEAYVESVEETFVESADEACVADTIAMECEKPVAMSYTMEQTEPASVEVGESRKSVNGIAIDSDKLQDSAYQQFGFEEYDIDNDGIEESITLSYNPYDDERKLSVLATDKETGELKYTGEFLPDTDSEAAWFACDLIVGEDGLYVQISEEGNTVKTCRLIIDNGTVVFAEIAD